MYLCMHTHTHHTASLLCSCLCVCSTANNDYRASSLTKIKGGKKKEERNESRIIKQSADISLQRRVKVFAFSFILLLLSVLILDY